MSRTGNLADGLLAAIEMPKPRTQRLRSGSQLSGITDSGFAEQVSAFELAVMRSTTRASHVAETDDSAGARQKRTHSAEAHDKMKPRPRPIGAARQALLLLDEAPNRGRADASQASTAGETASVPREPSLAKNEVPSRLHISDANVDGTEFAEEAVEADRTKARFPVGTDKKNMPEARPLADRQRLPDGNPIGRADNRVPSPRDAGSNSRAIAREPGSALASVREPDRWGTSQLSARLGGVLISIVRQETHAPMAEGSPPVAQIANAVAAGILRADELQSAQATGVASSTPRPAGGVVRVLQVRLEPAELGTVSVRIKLDANALELRIDAEQPGTADLIRRDQGVLARLLQSVGYDVEVLTVHFAEPDRTLAISTSSSQQSPQNAVQQSVLQAQSGSTQPDGRSGGAYQNTSPQGRASGGGTERHPGEPQATGAARPIGVYV